MTFPSAKAGERRAQLLEQLVERGVSPNVASFVGATTLRIHAIGFEDRPPTESELEEMRGLVREAMQEGAMGVASALIYAPAFYAGTDELIALSEVAAEYDGLYASHLRDEGANMLEALDERISVPDAGVRGVFCGGTSMTPQVIRFLVEEALGGRATLVPTYGNTLMGLACHKPFDPADDYAVIYHAPQPRAVLRVVNPDRPDEVVKYGAWGRVHLTTLTKEFFVPGSLLEVSTVTATPVLAGMPDAFIVNFARSPVFAVEPGVPGLRVLAEYGPTPLRSGWAWGQEKLQGGAALVEADVGAGTLYLFGPQVTFRGQPYETFPLVFNGILLGAARETTLR